MATDDTSRVGWAFRLLFLALVVAPVVAQWIGGGADLLPVVDLPTPVAVDSAVLVRLLGLGVVAVVVLLFVRQKRRSRGQRAEEEASERDGDRQVEGSGEVYAPYAYNNQQQARRESKQIQDRAEEIAKADRDARRRR